MNARARAEVSWGETRSAAAPVIAIVDDHRLIAVLLMDLLRSAGYTVVDAYRPTADGIVAALGELHPTLTFLDHELGPAGSGIALVEAAKRHGATIALTASEDRLVHARYLESGADGVLSKTRGPSEILAIVELALAGEPITTDPVRQQLLTELRMARSRRHSRWRPLNLLTEREIETLRALCLGQSAGAIAEDWVVSIATVRSHIRSILMKFGVSSQLAAVALAHKSGWFDDDRGILNLDDASRRPTEEHASDTA